MAGISSKALAFGNPENKYRYNGIEKETDLQIEVYDAQLRELDGQTGRWWQVDPKTENMEMWSPYASNYDNPLRYSDPLGDEGQECCQGLKDWFIDKADRFVNTWSTIGEKISDTWSQMQENYQNRKEARALPWQQIADNPMSLLMYVEMGPIGGLVSTEGRMVMSEVNAVTRSNVNSIKTEISIVKSESNVVKAQSTTNPSKQAGSYVNEHVSGKVYNGKGPESRAKVSANNVAKKNNDPLKKSNWKPAPTEREAFKTEDKNIQKSGGPGSNKNYNKINSPGKKYNEQDKNKN